jgi:Virulence factor BrkB
VDTSSKARLRTCNRASFDSRPRSRILNSKYSISKTSHLCDDWPIEILRLSGRRPDSIGSDGGPLPIGKFILGLYLGSGAAGSAYGAASSLITLLLWIFYSAQILLFGAEFTEVYSNTYGSQVKPQ